jgi:hypothetical protein
MGLDRDIGRGANKLATRILGRPDERSRAALESYTSWIRANPYQLADLLYQADQLLSKH